MNSAESLLQVALKEPAQITQHLHAQCDTLSQAVVLYSGVMRRVTAILSMVILPSARSHLFFSLVSCLLSVDSLCPQAIIHPDTGEKIPMPFRMSGKGVSVFSVCVSVSWVVGSVLLVTSSGDWS